MTILSVVILTYIRPLDEIDEHIPAHSEWLKQGYADGVFLVSGRRVPRSGGVIIARSSQPEELEARLTGDPFHRLGLAEYAIYPFEPSMTAEVLRDAL